MIARAFVLIALALATTPTPASAQRTAQQGVTDLGTFEAWRAIAFEGQAGKQCYALGTPRASEPRNIQPGTDRRGTTNVFITFRPRQNVRNEVSIVVGYDFRPNSNATIEVVSGRGTRRFSLFTRAQGAWLQNAAEEAQLVEAMRGGREMRVRGTSARGTNTVDTYSLEGISAALDRAQRECR